MDGSTPKSFPRIAAQRSTLELIRSCGLARLAPDAVRRICEKYEISGDDCGVEAAAAFLPAELVK